MLRAVVKRVRTVLGGFAAPRPRTGETAHNRTPTKEACPTTTQLSDPYAQYGNKAVLIWLPDRNVAKVVRHRGKQLQTLGITSDGELWLFAEEALHLAERGGAVCLVDARPLSVKELYSLVIAKKKKKENTRIRRTGGEEEEQQSTEATSRQRKRRRDDDAEEEDDAREKTRASPAALPPLACYWVYAHLRTLGYVVFRPFAHRTGARSFDVGSPRLYDDDDDVGASRFPSRRTGATARLLAFEAHDPRPGGGFSKASMGKPAFFVLIATYAGTVPPVPVLVDLVQHTIPDGVHLKVAAVAGDGTVLLFDVDVGIPRLSQ